jgi:site-specific recombinase XerD
MHATLFVYPATLARYRAAPLLAERERFLAYCAEQRYTRKGLRKIAWLLLIVVSTTLARRRWVSTFEIQREARRHRVRFLRHSSDRGNCASTQRLFVHTARAWSRFLGRFVSDKPSRTAFERQLDAFEHFMREERGLSAVTMQTRRQQIGGFLSMLPCQVRSVRAITLLDVDDYLVRQSKHGWSRASPATLASSLRSFFRYAEGQHWCKPGVARAIDSPRIYADEGLPDSPDWSQVEALIASTESDDPVSIRDRAVIMLLALYGLRRGEVVRLRLEDIDWKAEVVRIVRPKQRRIQHYPLVSLFGDALVRYLREARPQCAWREIFLTMKAPLRPLSPGGATSIVRNRLGAIGVESAPRGPHSLRHACARHLLAQGFSLKQIGDQLGHRRASSTLHYAKLDLHGLREVGELSLGRLL